MVSLTVAVFEGFLGYPLQAIFVALLVAGAVALSRRKLVAALFLLMPLLLTVAASAARLYPFAPGRLTAFLVPGLLVFVAEGVERVRTLPFHGLAWVGAAAATIAAAGPAWGQVEGAPLERGSPETLPIRRREPGRFPDRAGFA